MKQLQIKSYYLMTRNASHAKLLLTTKFRTGRHKVCSHVMISRLSIKAFKTVREGSNVWTILVECYYRVDIVFFSLKTKRQFTGNISSFPKLIPNERVDVHIISF